MKIDTTINISKKNYNILFEFAKELNISLNELIILLLNQFLRSQFKEYKMFVRIKYQKRVKDIKWKTQHLWVTPEFYEKCLDLRKFHKLSLSNILAKAITLYLDKISGKLTDNNANVYMLICSIIDGCSTFITIWNKKGIEKIKPIIQKE